MHKNFMTIGQAVSEEFNYVLRDTSFYILDFN